ncbi:MAG TPA: hypothetical protein VNY51_09385 [Candidatus Dormibacteraeota bacterium]|nr:hypothetical protein [Candidatus Dormibacteraeota bacterium]
MFHRPPSEAQQTGHPGEESHDFFSWARRGCFDDAGNTLSAPSFAKARIVADRVTGAPGQM